MLQRRGVRLTLEQSYPPRPYLYVGAGKNTVRYTLNVQDPDSGFWKGTLKLAGPGGQSITTPFTWEVPSYTTSPECGGYSSGGGLFDMPCGVPVTLPAGAAAGSWRVAQVVVFDNSGARSTFKNPQAPSFTVTSNAVLTASNFAADPVELDNWREPAAGTVTCDLAGARKGLSSVALDFGDQGRCTQRGNASFAGGKVTVPFTMSEYGTGNCTVTGLAIVDGAGDVSLYGSRYHAPDPGLTVRQKPDTTPPVVTGASLNITSIPADEVGQRSPELTIRAEVLTAPIDEITTYLYDSEGRGRQLSFGGTSQAADGTVTAYLYLPYWELTPGTYTVGFRLADEGGLTSSWDMPDRAGSHAAPGGPVTLTITEAG